MTIERRVLQQSPQMRAADSGQTVGGYAALFNVDADIGGWWTERIAPGAFSDSVTGDVRALIDHDSGRVIGRTASGTLQLSEDERGLAVDIDLPDTNDGRDIGILIGRGDVSGMSFGFIVTAEEWDYEPEPPLRTINKVELFEVSIATFPAYDSTEIALRSSDAVRAKSSAQKNHRHAAKRLRMKANLAARMIGKR